jgi:L-rhamnose mutarotase
MTQRFCLTLDLKNDPALIAEYKRYHQKIWPEITESIKDSGIEDMEIYLLGTRMFMIMEVNEHFSFEAKAQADKTDPKVQEWENLMWNFQQSLPESKPGEKWLRMERIFKLEACCGNSPHKRRRKRKPSSRDEAAEAETRSDLTTRVNSCPSLLGRTFFRRAVPP